MSVHRPVHTPDRRPSISAEQHKATVAALIPRPPVMAVDVFRSAGLTLADDVVAPVALPFFTNSAMDGFAVRSIDTVDATEFDPTRLVVTRHVAAGSAEVLELKKGTAARIMTGAPLPIGADAVIPFERADTDGLTLRLHHPTGSGANVRRAGEDVHAGQCVLTKGTIVGPLQVGLLAAMGVQTVSVNPAQRVAIISTGTELAVRNTPLRHGQIYDANSALLATAVRGSGADLRMIESVTDSVTEFMAAFEVASAQADVVITTGGISAGDHEVVKQATSTLGVDFVSVAITPGRPQGVGIVAGTPLLAFPGNPLAAYVSFELFARPVLRESMGLIADERPVVRLTLAHPVSTKLGQRTIALGRHDSAGLVHLVTGRNKHGLGAAVTADCLVQFDEATDDLNAGEHVTAQLIAP